MSNPKELPSVALFTLDDVLNIARKDLYLRARLEELEQTVEELQDIQRADNYRHKEILSIAIRAASQPKKPTILFSQLVEDYKRDRLGSNEWTPKTQAENMAAYKLCIDIVGDLPIHDFDGDVALTYAETRMKLPPNINKMPEYRGRTISEIVALNPVPISTRKIDKNIERVNSLFKFATKKSKYALKYDPFEGRSLDDSKAKRREPFTTDGLVRLFGAVEHAERRYPTAYAYWLPIMGLLTGARINELCQLHLSDFEVVDGVHCINIQDEEEFQRVKNNSARRKVPIHSKLIELGLVRYVECLRAKGQDRLFPALRPIKMDTAKFRRSGSGRSENDAGLRENRRTFFTRSGTRSSRPC